MSAALRVPPSVPVPVTVIRWVPAGVSSAVETVRTEEPPVSTAGGSKAAVAPSGRPEAVRVTFCGSPDDVRVTTVLDAVLPCVVSTLAGVMSREKEGAGWPQSPGRPGSAACAGTDTASQDPLTVS
ncbi:hypothetical protein HFP71_33405 [Streptomyces sp. ARC32]